MIYIKGLTFHGRGRAREEIDEKDIPTQPNQAEENSRIFGEDEHARWPQCLEAKEDEGKEKADGLRRIGTPRDGEGR
jgi:hypothetical protein